MGVTSFPYTWCYSHILVLLTVQPEWWWKSLPACAMCLLPTNLLHPRLRWDDSARRQVSNSRRELWVPAASGAPLARPVTSRPRQRSRPRHRSSPTPPAIPSLLGYTILLQYAPVCYTILLQYRSRQSLGLQIFYARSGIEEKNDRDGLPCAWCAGEGTPLNVRNLKSVLVAFF